MPEHNTPFHFSKSVEAFYGDTRVQSAVELIVNQGIVFAPEADEWREVETYYDAVLSAWQTQVEHAKDLFRLWTTVWQGIPTEWIPVPPTPKDDELSLDPVRRWNEGYFERHFKFRHRTIKLWAMLGDDEKALDEIQIAFDVSKGARSLMKKGAVWDVPGSRWQFSDGAMRLTCSNGYNHGLDLTPLRAGAVEAIEFLSRFEG